MNGSTTPSAARGSTRPDQRTATGARAMAAAPSERGGRGPDSSGPRRLLEPQTEPSSLIMRMAYWATRRQFGRVLEPLRVLYNRLPRMLLVSLAFEHVQRGMRLDRGLRELVLFAVANWNECAFCSDLSLARAAQARLGLERFAALAELIGSRPEGAPPTALRPEQLGDVFSEREQLALSFATHAAAHRQLTAELRARVLAAFSEREVVELTWLCAAESYYNTVGHVAGLRSDRLAPGAGSA